MSKTLSKKTTKQNNNPTICNNKLLPTILMTNYNYYIYEKSKNIM